MQRASLDARLLRGAHDVASRRHRERWRLQPARARPGQVHRDGLAREVWGADSGRDGRRQRDGEGRLRVPRAALLSAAVGRLFAVIVVVIAAASATIFMLHVWWPP